MSKNFSIAAIIDNLTKQIDALEGTLWGEQVEWNGHDRHIDKAALHEIVKLIREEIKETLRIAECLTKLKKEEWINEQTVKQASNIKIIGVYEFLKHANP